MAERLVVLSDMWGVKKGLWITSYLGYLQQYYDIVFYDVQQLAHIDLTVKCSENLHEAFVNGGIDTAVAHLMRKEKQASHYLAFSTGGTIAWKANLKGLPMKSLYTVSATRIREEKAKPECKTTLVYGGNDAYMPKEQWAQKVGAEFEIIPNFGHELYSDEKIITKVCQDLLASVTQVHLKEKKAV
jgi:pimeloyl-ACP methyl ester carboxylesterase